MLAVLQWLAWQALECIKEQSTYTMTGKKNTIKEIVFFIILLSIYNIFLSHWNWWTKDELYDCMERRLTIGND